MTPDVVVDVGNSRIKWGRVAGGGVAEMASLAHGDTAGWDRQSGAWGLSAECRWAVAGVNPPATATFRQWAAGAVTEILDYRSVPLALDVDEPGRVGLDRLLGALAARTLVPSGPPVVTVDVGTAVTINFVDAAGVFRGGAIFPGPRLMARALGANTARLPDIDLTEIPSVDPLGRNTSAAIRAGVWAAVCGGIEKLVREYRPFGSWPWVVLTGGGLGADTVFDFRDPVSVMGVPHLNLEGIRLAAEALP